MDDGPTARFCPVLNDRLVLVFIHLRDITLIILIQRQDDPLCQKIPQKSTTGLPDPVILLMPVLRIILQESHFAHPVHKRILLIQLHDSPEDKGIHDLLFDHIVIAALGKKSHPQLFIAHFPAVGPEDLDLVSHMRSRVEHLHKHPLAQRVGVHAEGIRRFPYIAHILDAAEKVPHQISKHVLVVLPLLHHMAEDTCHDGILLHLLLVQQTAAQLQKHLGIHAIGTAALYPLPRLLVHAPDDHTAHDLPALPAFHVLRPKGQQILIQLPHPVPGIVKAHQHHAQFPLHRLRDPVRIRQQQKQIYVVVLNRKCLLIFKTCIHRIPQVVSHKR